KVTAGLAPRARTSTASRAAMEWPQEAVGAAARDRSPSSACRWCRAARSCHPRCLDVGAGAATVAAPVLWRLLATYLRPYRARIAIVVVLQLAATLAMLF